MATIADQVISALTLSGVRRVYGLPGDSSQRLHRRHPPQR